MRRAPDPFPRRAAWRVVALWLAVCPVAVADPCSPPADLPEVELRRVVDGDTLQLASGERVRMVGLDAPEFGRDGRPDDPLAREARAHLVTLTELAGRRVRLRHGEERRDRYGRTLAVVYTDRHGDLAAHLLANGLALVAVVPPNLDALECHVAAERRARDAALGLWALTPGPVVGSTELDRTGFAIVRGRAGRWRERRDERVLTLEGGFVIRVRDDAAARWFIDDDLSRYEEREVEVRGWVHPWGRNGRAVTVEHPAALRPIIEVFPTDDPR